MIRAILRDDRVLLRSAGANKKNFASRSKVEKIAFKNLRCCKSSEKAFTQAEKRFGN